VIIFIQFSQIIQNDKLKKKLEIKFAYVTKDTAGTSMKNHIYHYITPFEMATCDSDGMADNCITYQ
jgi:hypothetical protein